MDLLGHRGDGTLAPDRMMNEVVPPYSMTTATQIFHSSPNYYLGRQFRILPLSLPFFQKIPQETRTFRNDRRDSNLQIPFERGPWHGRCCRLHNVVHNSPQLTVRRSHPKGTEKNKSPTNALQRKSFIWLPPSQPNLRDHLHFAHESEPTALCTS